MKNQIKFIKLVFVWLNDQFTKLSSFYSVKIRQVKIQTKEKTKTHPKTKLSPTFSGSKKNLNNDTKTGQTRRSLSSSSIFEKVISL